MFLLNKIIKNNKLNYPQKNVGLAHGFKTMYKAFQTTHGFTIHGYMVGGARPLNNPWFYCTWFKRALRMVLRPCARPPKQPIVVGGPCIWF